jgi:hypothetical protein
MRVQTNEKGKSPYVRYGKTPYQYRYKSCSHRRDSGKPNALYQQAAGWAGDVCAVCNIILKNFARDRQHG